MSSEIQTSRQTTLCSLSLTPTCNSVYLINRAIQRSTAGAVTSFTHSSVITQTTECGGREEMLPVKGVLQTLFSSQASILVNEGHTVTIISFAAFALIF